MSGDAGALRKQEQTPELTNQNYPGMYVSILAYCGTDILPKKTVPADNVLVAYCFYYGNGYFTCSNHCISGEDCDPQSGISNKIPAARFEEWANAIDPANFQIWYYPLNAYGVAFHSPYLTTIREDMEYLASFGVEHVYLCSKTSNGLNNDELGRYIFTLVTWDTSLTDGDVDALIAEWFNIVYGDAGEYLYEYTQMCEKAGDMAGCWCSFHSDSSDKVNNRYMADNFDMMYEMFRSAIAAADTEYQQELVERYMGGMLYICIGIAYEDRYTNGTDEQRAVIAERYTEMHRIFRKYNLAVYDDLLERTYAPEVLDLETNPFDSWCTKWGN